MPGDYHLGMTSSRLKPIIVMPALNEVESIVAVIKNIQKVQPAIPILVVDDGSSDGTATVAASAGARVLSLPFNLGVGGAMRLGFRFALQEGFNAVVQIDADGQHDPAHVGVLIEQLAHVDIVIGARFAGTGNYTVRGPRKWAMRFLSGVLSSVTGTKLTDTTSGFKANGPRAVSLFARHFPAEYLGDTIEALVLASRAGLTVAQVPVEMRERMGGTPSHNPVKSTIYLGRAGIALLFALVRPRLSAELEASE